MKLTVLYDNCASPYLARLTLLQLLGRTVKIHVFMRSDADDELHDHPWGFWSLVLSGRYYEQNADGNMIIRKAGDFCYRPANWKHRIVIAPGESCATLVVTRKTSREWGFWRGSNFIPWRKFVSDREC